jgi:hypothetical protein
MASAGATIGGYRLPDKDFGLRYRSSTYDIYDVLDLPCQNHDLKVSISPDGKTFSPPARAVTLHIDAGAL